MCRDVGEGFLGLIVKCQTVSLLTSLLIPSLLSPLLLLMLSPCHRTAISRYLSTDVDRAVKTTYRFVVIDNVDQVPGSAQQSLKRIMEEYLNSAKFILIASDANKIISNVQSRGVSVRTHAISEKDGLLVILAILHRMCVG